MDVVAATLRREASRVLAEPPAPGMAGGVEEPGCSPCTAPTEGLLKPAPSSWGTPAPEMGTATLLPPPSLHRAACANVTITNAFARSRPRSRDGQTLLRDNLALQRSPGPGRAISSWLGHPRAVAVPAPVFGQCAFKRTGAARNWVLAAPRDPLLRAQGAAPESFSLQMPGPDPARREEPGGTRGA